MNLNTVLRWWWSFDVAKLWRKAHGEIVQCVAAPGEDLRKIQLILTPINLTLVSLMIKILDFQLTSAPVSTPHKKE